MPATPSQAKIIYKTPKQRIPAPLLSWLTATGSLTAQFEALAGQPLQVVPTFEGFKCLDTKASQSLNQTRPQMAWVREVLLYGDDDAPWAKAQSIFPIGCLQGKAKRLRHLGKTPLGYVLFARHKPRCQRTITTTECTALSVKQAHTHKNQIYTCYTRQNYYDWLSGRILVEEAFLPAFLERLENV